MYKNKIVKFLSNFIPIKSLRKIFKEKFLTSIIENRGKNNKLILVDEYGNEVKSKYIKNLHIKFCGDNNVAKIYYKFNTKNKTIIAMHKDATLEIGVSNHEINIKVPGWIADSCKLYIGNNVSISDAVFLILDEANMTINIADNCMLSSGVVFRSSDAHIIVDNKTSQRINFPEDITIGEHTWIGMGATILKGANIPPNSIIGAKSVYTKSSNPKDLSNWDGGIFVGQPAKLKKTNVTWYRDEYEYKQAQTLVAVERVGVFLFAQKINNLANVA